jgi:hypothetical protein
MARSKMNPRLKKVKLQPCVERWKIDKLGGEKATVKKILVYIDKLVI